MFCLVIVNIIMGREAMSSLFLLNAFESRTSSRHTDFLEERNNGIVIFLRSTYLGVNYTSVLYIADELSSFSGIKHMQVKRFHQGERTLQNCKVRLSAATHSHSH